MNRTGLGQINSAVEFFIEDATPEQTLLIYLSGHGVHHSGTDYLVPSDAFTRSRNFPSGCVPIEFGRYVEHSRAGNVLVFIDACREGIDLREMGAINATSWSERRVERTGTRRFAYVYACSPGERARYVTAGAATFSLFSRSLTEIAENESGPRTLAELKPTLQDALDSLASDSQVPRQQIRVLTETDTNGFVVFPRKERDQDTSRRDNWAIQARDHVAWKQVGDGPGADGLYEATVALVEQLAAKWESDARTLKDDPWRDQQFAVRMNSKIRWLLQTVLNPDKLKLSSAEAALLVAFPFLYESFWARHAARRCHVNPQDLVGDSSDEGRRFRNFAAGHGRLLRRAKRASEAGDASVVSAIGWWLFHRWLARQPDCYQPGQIISELLAFENVAGSGDLDILTGEVFEPERVLEMLRALQMDTALLTRSDRKSTLSPIRQVAGGTENEQGVREQLLAYLLTTAYLFTIDATGLPEVVVDHLGISFGVNIPDIHTTIREAKWIAQGRTRILEARCNHPAVELALREHAAQIDALLTEIDTAAGDNGSLVPLTDMPAHATGDRVQAVTLAGGSRAYDSSGFRFRLADDRIQELLMGAQLYGDPALAIRELYQNALDACRYRQARGEYLRSKGARSAPWLGEIVFTQGIDEHGRPYLDCTDNGVGMGMRELVSIFSYAGIRFTDLPEFIEEQAEWEEAGITLHPNSRFGIGVLSYFMLADEITVTTCRFDRAGRPRNVLEVHIAGPGALFRVRDLGSGERSFTTVRLHLRDTDTPVSCVDLLRRILWIPEYQVTATDPGGSHTWRAGRLSEIAPIGSDDPLAAGARRRAEHVDATTTPEVWWCDSSGGILADGLWAGTPLFGAVVNLTGPFMPQLTVDRKQMLDYDKKRVRKLLHQESAALTPEAAKVLTHEWLLYLADYDPALADVIFEQALTVGRRPWIAAGQEADITIVGCFPDKKLLLGGISKGSPVHLRSGMRAYNRGRTAYIPDVISTWRALAWSRSGLIPGLSVVSLSHIPVARPSDYLLLNSGRRRGDDRSTALQNNSWLSDEDPVPFGYVIAAAVGTGQTPAQVVARLTELGFSTPDPASLPPSTNRTDRTIISAHLDGHQPWLAIDDPVPAGHVIAAAAGTGQTPAQVVARLTELGFTTPDPATLPTSTDPSDRIIIIIMKLNRPSPGLAADHPVTPAGVTAAAAETGRSPRDVAARMKELGFSTPDPASLPPSTDPSDRIIITADLDGHQPWLAADNPVPIGHVIAAAVETGQTPAQVAARLHKLGFTTPDPATLPTNIEPNDHIITSANMDGNRPWLPADQPIPAGRVTTAALGTGQTPAQVAARLHKLGFTTPDPATLPTNIEPNDHIIVTADLDGQQPWLAADNPVPIGHVIAAAVETGQTPAQVTARLHKLGFTTPDPATLPTNIEPSDRIFVRAPLDSRSPWLAIDQPVPHAHVIAAAVETGQTPAQVAARLHKLGFTTPDPATLPTNIEPNDRIIVTADRTGSSPWLHIDNPVPIGHVIAAAVETGQTPAQVAARLKMLGFTTPDPASLATKSEPMDDIIVSTNLDGHRPWLSPDQPISPGRLIAAAGKTGKSPADVATRLVTLGFVVSPLVMIHNELEQSPA